MDEAGGRGATHTAPRSLDDLWALRSDFEDLVVPEMGGETFRFYALSGLARAELADDMAAIAKLQEEIGTGASRDPRVMRAVGLFQGRACAASLGYPLEDWDRFGSIVADDVLDKMYAVVARLSGLDRAAQERAAERLPRRRSAGSGTA